MIQHTRTTRLEGILKHYLTHYQYQYMEEQGKVPCTVKAKVAEVVDLLNLKGIDFQQTLIEQKPTEYDFLFPKNRYYKYYTHYLFEHGPTSRERMKELEKHGRTLEGTIETLAVGAMSEILRQQMRQGHQPYTPLGNQTYEHHFTYNLADCETLEKIKALEAKHKDLISRKKTTKTTEKSVVDKNPTKHDQVRKEIGANADGSLGAYGGKKYEGLGSRDQFSTFRREQSQSYYSNLQQKLRQG